MLCAFPKDTMDCLGLLNIANSNGSPSLGGGGAGRNPGPRVAFYPFHHPDGKVGMPPMVVAQVVGCGSMLYAIATLPV